MRLDRAGAQRRFVKKMQLLRKPPRSALLQEAANAQAQATLLEQQIAFLSEPPVDPHAMHDD
jgi:hypothetical protein